MASTRASSPVSPVTPNAAVSHEASNRETAKPIARPPAPPTAANTTLSVSSCRTMAPRLPPSAMRVAISGLRATPRATSRPAMFTQPISSTTPTAAPENQQRPARVVSEAALQRYGAEAHGDVVTTASIALARQLRRRGRDLIGGLRPADAVFQPRDEPVVLA